jgi:hypothetical protein
VNEINLLNLGTSSFAEYFYANSTDKFICINLIGEKHRVCGEANPPCDLCNSVVSSANDKTTEMGSSGSFVASWSEFRPFGQPCATNRRNYKSRVYYSSAF